MRDKYSSAFDGIYDAIENGVDPLTAVRDHAHHFREDGLGVLGIAHYLFGHLNREPIDTNRSEELA